MRFNMLKKFLIEQLNQANLDLNPTQIDQLMQYLLLLEKWNKTYNLTAIRDPKEMITKHLLDSLVISPYLKGNTFIDVGTGAGLPGIPLSIANPDLQFTLLDSLGKRIRFLKQVQMTLNLKNVTLVQSRVEDYQVKDGHEAQFDGVISRAFASLTEMVQWCQHLPCQNGLFYALKGDIQADEIAQLPAQFKIKKQIALSVPNLSAKRFLFLIEPQKG